MSISERIFQIMKERHLSQKTFSELTGISYSTISDWKRKNTSPTADRIMTICNVLQVTPEFLLEGDIDKMPSAPFDFSGSFDPQVLRLIEFYTNLDDDRKRLLWIYIETLNLLKLDS